MRSDSYWIDEAIRDITGMVLDLGPVPIDRVEPVIKRDDEAVAERWRQAERNADRTFRGLPPEWPQPPECTLQAARYVAALDADDPERAPAFVAGRSAIECAAIAKFLKASQS
jgi:hypothetical protein